MFKKWAVFRTGEPVRPNESKVRGAALSHSIPCTARVGVAPTSETGDGIICGHAEDSSFSRDRPARAGGCQQRQLAEDLLA